MLEGKRLGRNLYWGKPQTFWKHKNWKQVTEVKETKYPKLGKWWLINDFFSGTEVDGKTIPVPGTELSAKFLLLQNACKRSPSKVFLNGILK